MHILDKWCQARVDLDKIEKKIKRRNILLSIGAILTLAGLLGGILIYGAFFSIMFIGMAIAKWSDFGYLELSNNALEAKAEYKAVEREFYSTWLNDAYSFNA